MENSNEILFSGFNQDSGCFASGNESGFNIYNTSPLKKTFSREFEGGISIVEMIYRCNILALVGGGSSPKFSPDQVLIWDDSEQRCIGELKFKSQVKSVKMSNELIVVILESRIYVYTLASIIMQDAFETFPNPDGVCCLNNQILATPDKEQGLVRIKNYKADIVNTFKVHDTHI